ncbi:hypothetical protein R2R35_19695 [Anaerocolumna sp. AGMB13020]|uniref:hypothetical protein n=1 Tax=Anaerocolumna sp. AGMB13020 TaxID=3081750 RepID=UPI0029537C5D|nr:hypothetical protein [Anaerocolumna sp. AGMB13020]WOO35996.1 hypothetical protein R2R35_19695 [Anaerocolumna sp. AGMB13020]
MNGEVSKEVTEREKEQMRAKVRKAVEQDGFLALSESNFDIITKAIKELHSVYQEKANTFEKNINTQASRMQTKVNELKNQYADKVTDANEKGKLMAQAIAYGDEEKAGLLENEIDQLNEEAFKIEKKLQTFADSAISGDKKLYIEASEAYKEYTRGKEIGEAGRLELMEIIKEKEEEIKKMRALMVGLERITSLIPNTHEGAQRVKFYENIHGLIDVKGHRAGTDNEAKRRFVDGTTAGIENTIAGRQLLKELGEEVPDIKEQVILKERPRGAI